LKTVEKGGWKKIQRRKVLTFEEELQKKSGTEMHS
jgi:hypothetical protein